MFGALTEKFQGLFSSLGKERSLTEKNISDAVRAVRLALLDADVNYKLATTFVKRVKEKALGEKVLGSISPQDQFTSIIHEELIDLMGTEEAPLTLKSGLNVVMLVGLQGAGKTTQTAKLAYLLKKKEFGKRPLVVACDLQRPAAIDQLEALASQNEIGFFGDRSENNPAKVASRGVEYARANGYDVVLLDTAGRLAIDEVLMKQLSDIQKAVSVDAVIFVASCAMGQDAVNTACEFDKQVGITGSILTMLDGSARAGAALSICHVTGKPLMYEGVGEKISDLQVFNPQSMADRILGMGDVINLVKKAQEHMDEEENKALEKKFLKAQFTYDDFLSQMGKLQKMGPLKGLLKMMPGADQIPDLEESTRDFQSMKAMIQSMTPKERGCLVEMEPSRRRRIAMGSGCDIHEVHKLVKNFKQLRKMAKELPKFKKKMKKLEGMGFGDMAKHLNF
ncbi:MAG: Signal recognition particle protein [Chlamydiia bacterium]|nr:Signal recognition particle protein [Chlamydiia bacterium]